MGKKTRKICSLIVVCGVLLAIPAVSAVKWFWADLMSVDAPRAGQTLDYHPVEIVVSFKDGAIASTFTASLNGHNITAQFKPIPGGVHAYVTPGDGLNCCIIGKNLPPSKINFLTTDIQGNGYKKDEHVTQFSVAYFPVKTARDDKGVWFITGGSLGDVEESMGYAVATDRLWQMESYRRSARGKLSEIFGSSQLSTDVFMRTIGYSDQELTAGFYALDKETQIVVQSYVDGINRRISEIVAKPALMPLEFVATGCPLNNWSKEDLLAWESLMLRQFDCEALGQGQMQNAALYQKLTGVYGPAAGSGMFNDLRWLNDPEALTYIPPVSTTAMTMAQAAPSAGIQAPEVTGSLVGSVDFGAVSENLTQQFNTVTENLKNINAFVKMGSYAWTVSGKKTKDRLPIIYSGPQMGFSVPSIILEGSIRGGGLNISGMAIPGLPGIVIGRTPHHAWSMQVGHARTVDYYLESKSSVALNRYETIHVKAATPYDVTMPIWRSVNGHGPVINPIPFNPETYVPNPANPIMCWKYSHWGYEFNTIKAYLKFARAQSMDDFGKGIDDVGVSQHFCYADKDGNIAYWMSGRDPVRPAAEWRLPQGSFGYQQEWGSGLIPKSTDRNNAKGYYCGWNNKSNPNYNDSINNPGYCFGPFHRAHVVDDYLSANNNLTYENVRDLALNIATTDSFGGGGIPWDFVENYFINAVNNAVPNAQRQAALDLLAAWDGHFVKGGSSEWRDGLDRADAWELQDAWIREVIRLTFQDELTFPDEMTPGATTTYSKESVNRLFNVLLHSLAGSSSGIVNTYNWFANKDLTKPQTADAIIVQALDTVLVILDGQPWGTGKRGVIDFTDAFFASPTNPKGVIHSMPFSSRSTYAHCVEFGRFGPIRIESMFPLGESGYIPANFNGNNWDPNFFSMTSIFDPFEPRPFPLFW